MKLLAFGTLWIACSVFAQDRPVEITGPGGQAMHATTPPVDRVKQLSKRFPPELIVPIAPAGTATLLRRYCVYPLLDTKSLSIKPCWKDSRKLRLVAPLENIVPPTKPATPPDKIR